MILLIDETATSAGQDASFTRWSRIVPLLQTENVDVELITLRGEGRLNTFVRAQGMASSTLAFRGLSNLVPTALKLGRLLNSAKADLLCGDEIVPACISGLARRASRSDLPVVFIREHCSGGFKVRSASKLAARLTDYTLGPSRAVSIAAVRDDRSAPTRVGFVHNGVPRPRAVTIQERARAKEDLGIPPGAPIVCAVSRLRAEKGIDVLLEAMPLVTDAGGRPPHLVVVGDGPLEAELKRKAESILSPCYFVGHSSDVALWYTMADVFVAPSLRESFGLTVAEAMACGRPVVASRVEGLPEVVDDGVTGLLVPSRDPRALANAISSLLRDPSLADQMGKRGYERYSRLFTIEEMCKGWIQHWWRALGDPKES